MYLGGFYRLYEKVYNEQVFNTLTIGVNTPFIGSYSDRNPFDPMDEGDQKYKITFNTEVMYVKSHCHWYLHVMLFGFGLYIKRQWSY